MSKYITETELDTISKINLELNNKDDSFVFSDEMDILTEVGSVTMSATSNAFERFLNRKVTISPPKVIVRSIEEATERFNKQMAVAAIKVQGDIVGDTLLAIEPRVGAVIAGLISEAVGSEEKVNMTASSLSALSESINFVASYLFQSLSSMTGLNVEPYTAEMQLWEGNISKQLKKHYGQKIVFCFESTITIESFVMGEFWQIFAKEHVQAILEGLLKKKNHKVLVAEKEAVDEDEVLRPVVMPTQARRMQVSSPVKPIPTDSPEPPFPELGVKKSMLKSFNDEDESSHHKNLDLVMDMPVEISVMLGKTKKTIKDILALREGSVVELNNLVDKPVDIHINGKLIAQGEVVLVGENFGVRMIQILSREQRVESFC